MGSSSPFSLTWLLSLSPTTTLTLSSAQSNGNCRRFGSSPSFLVLSLPLLPGSSAVPSSCPTVVSSRDTAASSTFFSSKSPLPRTGSSSSPVVLHFPGLHPGRCHRCRGRSRHCLLCLRLVL